MIHNFQMILHLTFALLLLIFLYFMTKYLLKPYLLMRKFRYVKGVKFEPLNPILGFFKNYAPNFEKYGDELKWRKQYARKNPDTRVIVYNILDQAFLVIMDIKLIKQYFSKQDLYRKQQFLISNRIRLSGQSMLGLEGQAWSKRRRLFSNVFNFDFLNVSIPVVENIINQKIKAAQKQGQIIAQQFSVSIAGTAVLKIFFGMACNDKIDDKQIAIWLNQFLNKGIQAETSPRFFMFGVKILNLGVFSEDRAINNQWKVFKSWAQQQVKKTLNQQASEKNILSLLKQRNLIETQQGLTVGNIIDEFIGLFEAGTETTTLLTTMCLYYIMIYPEHQQTLKEQIRNAPQPKTIAQYNKYPFLDAMIKETFRFYGLVSTTFVRQALQDHYLGEIPIPKGTLIGPAWLENNFNPEFFDQVDKFDPYRWIKPESEKNKSQQYQFLFTPFSAGPRNCIGKSFALMEIKAIIWNLLSNFDLKLKQGYVLKLKNRALYGPCNPLPVILEPIKKIEKQI